MQVDPGACVRRAQTWVTPQAAHSGGGERDRRWRTHPRFAGDGYVLLDSLRVGPDDVRHDNAAALLAGLENPSLSTLRALVSAVCRRLRAPELRRLRDVMLAWAAWQAKRRLGLELEVADMAEAVRLEDYDDVDAYFAARIQAWKEEYRAVGQRESMRRQAAMKFDAETAARLGVVLEGVTDQSVFDGVLAALLECETTSDLLERAAKARRRANGDNSR